MDKKVNIYSLFCQLYIVYLLIIYVCFNTKLQPKVEDFQRENEMEQKA